MDDDDRYETCHECGCAVENSTYGWKLHLAWHERVQLKET